MAALLNRAVLEHKFIPAPSTENTFRRAGMDQSLPRASSWVPPRPHHGV